VYVYTFLKSLFQCVPSNLHAVTCYGQMNTTYLRWSWLHHWLKTRTLPATSFPVWCTFCSFRGLTSDPDCYENFLGKLTHREDGNARPSWDHIHVYLLIRARMNLGVDVSFIYIKRGISLRRRMRDTLIDILKYISWGNYRLRALARYGWNGTFNGRVTEH
jgi:hypothetical protein